MRRLYFFTSGRERKISRREIFLFNRNNPHLLHLALIPLIVSNIQTPLGRTYSRTYSRTYTGYSHWCDLKSLV